MIDIGRPYTEYVKDYANLETNYKWEPSNDEWKFYEIIEKMLLAFAQVATAFSQQTFSNTTLWVSRFHWEY